MEIGYITDRTNPILLDFDLMTLNPINDVQVKVIEDMNLGVVFAGERLSTKNSQNNGHPAKIEIKGKNKKLKQMYLYQKSNKIVSNQRRNGNKSGNFFLQSEIVSLILNIKSGAKW